MSREVVTSEMEYPFPQLYLQISDKWICHSSRLSPTISEVPHVDQMLVPIAMPLTDHPEIIASLFKLT